MATYAYSFGVDWSIFKFLERFDDFSGGMNPRQGTSPQKQ